MADRGDYYNVDRYTGKYYKDIEDLTQYQKSFMEKMEKIEKEVETKEQKMIKEQRMLRGLVKLLNRAGLSGEATREVSKFTGNTVWCFRGMFKHSEYAIIPVGVENAKSEEECLRKIVREVCNIIKGLEDDRPKRVTQEMLF